MRRQFYSDQVVALLLLPLILPLLAVLFLIAVAVQGRPFCFASERMRAPGQPFMLLKIRTMHPPDPDAELGVLGGDNRHRVTALGAFLRTTRLDELPQILNVLRGDMRFIGPRPPLRRYAEAFPELYARVLKDTPPGITGLATVLLHGREERILSACRTAEETDSAYRRRCVPLKARVDLVYRERRGFVLNLWILWLTFARLRFARPQLRVHEAGSYYASPPLANH